MSFNSYALALWPSSALQSHALGAGLALNPASALALNPSAALALNPSAALALNPSAALALNPANALALALQSSPALALALQGSPALALALQGSPALALQSSSALALGGGGTTTGYFSGAEGVPRSGYATAADLGPLPWTLDFNEDNFWGPFPTKHRSNPLQTPRWRDEDWDPGLRTWALPFESAIEAWLHGADGAAPATMMVRELSRQYDRWKPTAPDQPSAAAPAAGAATRCRWIGEADLKWHLQSGPDRWTDTNRQIGELVDLMKQSRTPYLEEAWVQSDAGMRYFVQMLGLNAQAKPWTRQLMECGLALAKVVYMHYKAHFKRVRPSTLCPGLAPPWGPPGHPSFPSGHATACHFVALLLLEIQPLAERFGVFDEHADGGRAVTAADLAGPYGQDLRSPLLWLAHRMARNRERLGLHFASDSSAGRSIAFGLWEAVFRSDGADGAQRRIDLPSLQRVLTLARAEWKTDGAPAALKPAPTPPQTPPPPSSRAKAAAKPLAKRAR